jgi:hypothetical protein
MFGVVSFTVRLCFVVLSILTIEQARQLLANLYRLQDNTAIDLSKCSLCNSTDDDIITLACRHTFCRSCSQANSIGLNANSDDCPCCAKNLKKKMKQVWETMKSNIETLELSTKLQQILDLLK